MAKHVVADVGLAVRLADAGKGTVAKPRELVTQMRNRLADAGKGTVAKQSPCRAARGSVLPTLEKELWQSKVVVLLVAVMVLPTLEKELWQSAPSVS